MTLVQRIAEALDEANVLANLVEYRECGLVHLDSKPQAESIIARVLRNNALDIVSDMNAQGFVLFTETGGDVTVDEATEALLDAMQGDSYE